MKLIRKLTTITAILAATSLIGCSYLEDPGTSKKIKQQETDTAEVEKSYETDKEAPVYNDIKKVGNEQYGYVNVPENWVRFTDYDGNNSFQVSNPEKTQIISLNIFDTPSNLTLEDCANIVAHNMDNNGAENVNGGKVKFKEYDAIQVYGAYDSGKYFVVTWIFKTEDGRIRYIAAEGTAEKVNEVVSFIENSGWTLN